MIKNRYIFSDYDMDTAKSLGKSLGIPEAIALLLVRQNIRTTDDARVFFEPTFDDLYDPYLMKGMLPAVSRIRQAVENREKVTIFCDYDVDGTSACSMLYLYLKHKSADIHYRLPDRNNDGYGMNPDAAQAMVDDGTKLVITVDCGITNLEETKILKKNGVSVIITDHHECGEKLPEADVILNPKQPDCGYPYRTLSGAGIVFKILQGLGGNEAMQYVDYAALGTVADIVPLNGENRIIAKLGLEKMNHNIACGIGLIRSYVLTDEKKIDEYHIGFGFGPRINAAGRMDTAHLAMDVLLAEKATSEAKAAASRINALNEERKDICDKIVTEAMSQIIEQNMLNEIGALFVAGDWEPGVVGICASKLVQQFGRPALVFALKGDEAVCSARSIPEINIFEVLEQFKEYYIKFGGHHMAAGLTIKAADFDALKESVNKYLNQSVDESLFVPRISYDIDAGDTIDITFANALLKLAPFGQENPKPKLLFRNQSVDGKHYFGRQTKAHFKFNIGGDRKSMQAVKFYFSERDDAIMHADIIGTLNISDYTGKPELFIDYFESAALDSGEQHPAYALENTLERIAAIDTAPNKEAVPLDEVIAYIENTVNRSAFGTALLIEDVCQLALLSENKSLNAMISSGRLMVRLASAYRVPLNAVIYMENPTLSFKPYREIVTLYGDSLMIENKDTRLKSFVVQELNARYQTEKTAFKINREGISKGYVWLKKRFRSGSGFASFDALYQALSAGTGLSKKQAVSVVKILCELDLIQLSKSDMIRGKLITHQDKKDLKQSMVFKSLQGGGD